MLRPSVKPPLRPQFMLPMLLCTAASLTTGHAAEELRKAVPVSVGKPTAAAPAAPEKKAEAKPQAVSEPLELKPAVPVPPKTPEKKPEAPKEMIKEQLELKPAVPVAPKPAMTGEAPAKEKPADKKDVPAAPPAKSGEEKFEARPAVLKGNNQAASGMMGKGDMEVARQLKKLNSTQIQEFAGTYARLGNKTMANLLVSELFRRDANDPVAAKLKKEVSDISVLPDDPEAIKAQQLLIAGKASEAASMLQKLKSERYSDRVFRYQQDYAYALLQSGQEAAAEAAFKELLAQPEAGEEARSDASKTLREMAVEALLQRGQGALTAKDARNALAVADQLLKSDPLDVQGVALRAAVLSMTGQPKEAISYLEGLKGKYKNGFPHNRPLADAYSDDRQSEKAIELYKLVIANSAKETADDIADAKKRLVEISRDDKIVAGFNALQNNKVNAAAAALQELKIEHANNLDVKTLEASILTKERRWKEARALLEEVQVLQGATFDGAYALGEAYANEGDWKQAVQYLTIASNDKGSDAASQGEASRLARDIQARYLPTADVSLYGQSANEGTLFRQTAELSSGVVADKNIFFLRSIVAELKAGSGGVDTGSTTQAQVELAWRRLLNRGFYGEVSAGMHDDGAMVGARYGKYEGPGMAWSVGVQKGGRATDTLALESLNGREDYVDVVVGSNFSNRFYLEARAFARNVDIGGRDLGSGFGLQGMAAYSFLPETKKRPEVAAMYFNQISTFNGDGGTFEVRRAQVTADGLVARRINRHGVGLIASKRFSKNVQGFVSGGVSYEFASRQAEARVGAGVEANLGPKTTLNIGVEYFTNGNARNSGGDVLSGTVSIRHSF
jgi:hypothetical protein